MANSALGAGKGKASVDYEPAFTIEKTGKDSNRITLKDSAIDRLGLKTAQVTLSKLVNSHWLGGKILILGNSETDDTALELISIPKTKEIRSSDPEIITVFANVNGEEHKIIATRT